MHRYANRVRPRVSGTNSLDPVAHSSDEHSALGTPLALIRLALVDSFPWSSWLIPLSHHQCHLLLRFCNNSTAKVYVSRENGGTPSRSVGCPLPALAIMAILHEQFACFCLHTAMYTLTAVCHDEPQSISSKSESLAQTHKARLQIEVRPKAKSNV